MIDVKMTKNETLPLINKSDVFDLTEKDEVKLDRKNDKTAQKNEGVSVVWKNLRVTAEIKKHHVFRKSTSNCKEIIHDVNGYVEPRSLVAILGASGSGKSTLMSALANRQSGDLNVDGDIKINGKKLQQKLMREISGFVYQDELFIPALTVFEHLYFAARLKLDKHFTAEYHKKLVEELIREVGLTKCARNFIGNTHYGEEQMILSGGERKRLSVATELLTNPSLLFCDEPTTGLDSFTSLKLITTMKNMTYRRGTTIICSIHQPSEQIFSLFHQIILLYEGRIAFSGTSKEALIFFQSVGCDYDEELNPANYLIECLAVVPGRESETSIKASNICKEFDKSQYAEIINDRIDTESHETDEHIGFIKKNKRISWFYMLYLLAYRETLVNMRDPATNRMEMTKKLISAVIIGICMMGSVTMTQKGIKALQGALFYMVSENWIGTVFYVLGYYSNKMPIFFREYASDINTPMLFHLSNFISMIPLLVIGPILNVTLIYTLAGMRNSWMIFGWTIVFNISVNFTSAALGILVSLSTNNISEATMIFYPISIIYLMYFGIFANLRSIPWTVSWIKYTSWITYAMEVLFALQFDGINNIECSTKVDTPCFKTGQELLQFFDYGANNLIKNFIMICIIYSSLFILAYFALVIKLYFKAKR